MVHCFVLNSHQLYKFFYSQNCIILFWRAQHKELLLTWDLPLFPFDVQDLGESVMITISYWTVMTDLEGHHPGCRCSGSNEREGSSKAFPPTIPDAVMPAHCVTGSLWNTHARVCSPTETDIFHCSWKLKKKRKNKRFFPLVTKKAACSDILGKHAQW